MFGGGEDVEFIGHSRRLVAAMVAGDYSMVISEVTLLELEKAPAAVWAHLERVPESLVEVLALDAEAEALAAELSSRVVFGGAESGGVLQDSVGEDSTLDDERELMASFEASPAPSR